MNEDNNGEEPRKPDDEAEEDAHLDRSDLDALENPPQINFFADHVAFDKVAWHAAIKAAR